jgi:hypothetical protein
MIHYGLSEYDPIDGSATSIDPLRSLAWSVRLGDLVFPGSSGRIWRSRYISALCFLLKHAELEKDQEYRANYIKYRKYENAFILCLYQLKKEFQEQYDFNRVIGLDKADQLIKSNANGVHIHADLLANQMNLGPLGVHSVLLKDLKLIDDERELILLPDGERLANYYEASLGSSARIFLDPLKDAKVKLFKPTKFEGLDQSFLFELKRPNQKTEQRAILNLLYEDQTRRQCLEDVVKVANGDFITEAQFIDRLASVKSPLSAKYGLIFAYDKFQRVLHYFFDSIRQIPTDKFQFKLADAPQIKSAYIDQNNEIRSRSQDLVKAIDHYLANHEDEDGPALEIREYASGIIYACVDHADFTRFLVQHHMQHQRKKGKAPWIRLSSQATIEIAPSNINKKALPSFADYAESSTHSYRFSNCFKMMSDLGVTVAP